MGIKNWSDDTTILNAPNAVLVVRYLIYKIMSEKTLTKQFSDEIKKAIENYESKQNGFDKLSGHSIKVSNIKLKKKEQKVIADVKLFIDNTDGHPKTETYVDCEYPLDLLQIETDWHYCVKIVFEGYMPAHTKEEAIENVKDSFVDEFNINLDERTEIIEIEREI